MRAHGNWCGPGWTAGQYKDAKDLTDEDRNVPAVDELDAACKEHDIDLHDYPERANEINERFINKANRLGLTGHLFALAVGMLGPSPTITPENTMKGKQSKAKERWNKLRAKDDWNWDTRERSHAVQANSKFKSHEHAAYKRADNEENLQLAVQVAKAFTTEYTEPDASDFVTPKKPRLRGSVNVSPNDPIAKKLTMDVDQQGNDEQKQLQLRASTGTQTSAMNKALKETPTTFHRPQYGLPETFTTVLPVDLYFSVGFLDHTSAVIADFNMTGINTIIKNLSDWVTPADTAGINKGIFTRPMPYGTGTSFTTGSSFPTKVTNTNVIPAWKNYFERLYEVHTVQKCYWKLTVRNASGVYAESADALICQTYETYGDSSSGNVTPTDISVADVPLMPGMRCKLVHGQNNDQANMSTVIQMTGDYWPGKAGRNVKNDADVETWHGTSADPQFTELLRFWFFCNPLTQISTSGNPHKLNCCLQLKYIVQYKDLRGYVRYITQANPPDPIIQTLPQDASSVPS